MLRRAVEAGVNHIDTAQYYGPNVANELIREALHPYPDDLVIVSKVGAVRDDAGGWHAAQTPADLRVGVEDNLRTLGVEQLGAVNLRRIPEHDMPDERRVPLADQFAEMVALREEGKIAGVGISTAPLAEVDEAIRSAQITCVQNPYSLLARDDGGVLDRCIAAGIAFVPYFPLGSAFAGMPKVTDDARVRAVAARLGATPAQVGLAWLLAWPTTSCSSRARQPGGRAGTGFHGRRACSSETPGSAIESDDGDLPTKRNQPLRSRLDESVVGDPAVSSAHCKPLPPRL